jgi:hypothetical protein
MATKGRPEKVGDSETLKVVVPRPVYQYLVHLARNSYAGASVGEVVNHLLKLKLAELGAKLDVPPSPPPG